MRSTGLATILLVLQLAMPAGAFAADAAPAAQVPSPPVVGHADAGHRLYAVLCVDCHRLDDGVSEVGAPGLKDAVHRHGAVWLDRWLADPRGLAGTDARARALIDAGPDGLAMPALPAMQDAQNRADIIAFLSSLSDPGKEDKSAQ